jgi:hypothetical protein
MTGARRWAIAGACAVSGSLTWLTWPRPDSRIEVLPGGIPTVVDMFGRRSPLRDTLMVGGAGARRTVRVTNLDSVTHQLALFTVKAGQQMDYHVPPGTFGGFCSTHPKSGRLTIVVR